MYIRTIAIGIVAAVVLALTGCASGSGMSNSDGGYKYTPRFHESFAQKLTDGTEVICIATYDNGGVGLSCDWQGYHKKYDK